MKKISALVMSALLSSAAMANYVMTVNSGSKVVSEKKCSEVDSLKLVGHNISMFSNGISTPFATKDTLTLTFEYLDDTDKLPVATDTIDITYTNGEGVKVVNPYEGSIEITSVGEHVHVNCMNDLKDVVYHLQGISNNGSFVIESPRRFTLVLDNLRLISATENSPIRSYSNKTMTVVLPTGSSSSLEDSSNDTCNAVLRSKGQIVFSEEGSGKLKVTARAKRAIQTGDYIIVNGGEITATSTVGDAVKANDYFEMNGGSLQIVEGGLEVSEGYAVINGGTLLASSSAVDDKLIKIVKDSTRIGSEQNGSFVVNGGVVTLQVDGDGSKGVKAEHDILIKGGSVNCNVKGSYFIDALGDYTVSSMAKADRNFEISGGAVNIRIEPEALGGRGFGADSAIVISGDANVKIDDAAKNYYNAKDKVKVGYGIKCDGSITFAGNAVVEIVAEQTSYSAISLYSDKRVDVQGDAKVYLKSSSNTTMDGTASYMSLDGGVVVSLAGYNYSPNKFKLKSNGGYFVGVGSKASTIYSGTYGVAIDQTCQLGSSIAVKDVNGTQFAFTSPSSFDNSSVSSAWLVFTFPGLSSGATCTYSVGGTISSTNDFHGFYGNASYEGGTDYSFTGPMNKLNPVTISK